ncbi:MAG: YhbY family RNA-binding protein [Oscillospiraceae bacterium]|jgi:RNA-binding protein
MNSKQRAALRKCANSIDSIFSIGKGGIDEEVLSAVDDALKARELVKIHVLENSGTTAREACGILADKLSAEPIQCIGSKFVLYRRNEETDRYGDILK